MSKGVIIAGAGRGLVFAKLIATANPESRQKNAQNCVDWGIISNNTSTHQINRRVAGVVDTNIESHAKIRRELDINGLNNTPIFSSLENALAVIPESEADSVMIVTPNTTHAALVELSLANNRHVFLEKPIASTWEDVVKIHNAAQKYSNRTLILGFVLRYSTFYRRLKEICDSGIMGNIVMVQANERLAPDHCSSYRRGWRSKTLATGGSMNEKCSHDLDILCWLKERQGTPESIFSCGGQALFPKNDNLPKSCLDCGDRNCPFRITPQKLRNAKGSFLRDLGDTNSCVYHTDADVNTDQSSIIRFSDGTQAIFTMLMYSGKPGRDILIHGTNAMLSGDFESGKITLTNYRTGEVLDRSAKVTEWHGGGDALVLNDFFDSIDFASTPASVVNDGIMATRLALAADLSAKEQRLVKLSEFSL